MNQPSPQSVEAAAVLPHLQQQIGTLSLHLAAATALSEQRHALAVSQAARIAEQDARIAELEEQLREQTQPGEPGDGEPDSSARD